MNIELFKRECFFNERITVLLLLSISLFFNAADERTSKVIETYAQFDEINKIAQIRKISSSPEQYFAVLKNGNNLSAISSTDGTIECYRLMHGAYKTLRVSISEQYFYLLKSLFENNK